MDKKELVEKYKLKTGKKNGMFLSEEKLLEAIGEVPELSEEEQALLDDLNFEQITSEDVMINDEEPITDKLDKNDFNQPEETTNEEEMIKNTPDELTSMIRTIDGEPKVFAIINNQYVSWEQANIYKEKKIIRDAEIRLKALEAELNNLK